MISDTSSAVRRLAESQYALQGFGLGDPVRNADLGVSEHRALWDVGYTLYRSPYLREPVRGPPLPCLGESLRGTELLCFGDKHVASIWSTFGDMSYLVEVPWRSTELLPRRASALLRSMGELLRLAETIRTTKLLRVDGQSMCVHPWQRRGRSKRVQHLHEMATSLQRSFGSRLRETNIHPCA